MTTSEPTSGTDQRGRHARSSDEPEDDTTGSDADNHAADNHAAEDRAEPPAPEAAADAPQPDRGGTAPEGRETAPATTPRRPRLPGGTPLGRHPAGGALLMGSGLLLGLFLAPAILDRLDFDITDRAARVAYSAATRWPGGGEPWFWPSWVALLAGIAALVLIVVALVGARLPDLVVGGSAAVLAVTGARAAWSTLDVVHARLWDLLTVCALCIAVFGLALSALAHWRSDPEEKSGAGIGTAANAAVAGFGLALLLLLGGATVARVQAEGLGPPGPPHDVAGLLSIRAADAAVAGDLPGDWVPQVAAAQVADDAAASTYAAGHGLWGTRFPVLLVRGDDLGGAGLDDTWWVTVAAQGFGSEAEAAQWCTANQLGPPDCVPRRLAD